LIREVDISETVWLTVRDASRFLGVSEPTLRKWTDRGDVAAFRTPGGHRRYMLEALERFRSGLEQQGPDIRG
jgi:excisionase family DNA binding protein